jgi:hypothetical protein
MKGIVIGGATVLLTAIALQFRGEFSAQAGGTTVDLPAALTVPSDGWLVRDLPIGATEEVRTAAESTLRYDDYFLRAYQRGAVEFTIYVAHWKAGKFPPQMIAKHTPDMCWTLNGMTCVEKRHNVTTPAGNLALWPAQWRRFRTPEGRDIYTAFWHMVGDRPFDYGTRFYDVPHPLTFWREALRFAVGQQPEQFFFRVSSNVPPEELLREPAFEETLRAFGRLGLARQAVGR